MAKKGLSRRRREGQVTTDPGMVITDTEHALDNITDIGHVVRVIRRERKFQESKRKVTRIINAENRAYKTRLKAIRKN